MNHRIKSVEVVRYPVLRITFQDGFRGDCDLTDVIANGPSFGGLEDEAYFRTVGVGENGRAFGWKLDELGQEVDLCADATRIRMETEIVEQLAAQYGDRRSAAE